MAVPPTSAVQAKKRKHPPTFQHLPRDRALKLKKLWVEKKKLKSQWKAQKRKEGLDSGWSQPRISRQQDALDDEERHDGEPPDDEPGSEKSTSDAEESEEHDEPAPKKARIARKDEHLSAKSKGKQPIRSTSLQNDEPPEDVKDAKPSLRELMRQAYSRESLHTFKADPLHRRKGAVSSNQRGRLRGGGQSGRRGGGGSTEGGSSARESRGGRGSARGRDTGGPTRGGRGGHATGRGNRIGGGNEVRGQPNMKLRMEAMLERIRRDYS